MTTQSIKWVRPKERELVERLLSLASMDHKMTLEQFGLKPKDSRTAYALLKRMRGPQ